jgi:hemerythrin
MTFMTWTDELSVGVQTLDKQHVVLIETLNELHAAMLEGRARAAVGKILQSLMDYTRNHFATEEAMMEQAKYAALPTHRLIHRDLTRQVEEYVARFEKGDLTLSLHLLVFLSDWLTNHIQGEDQKYGPWMNEHGLR